MGRFLYPLIFLIAITGFIIGGGIEATFFHPIPNANYYGPPNLAKLEEQTPTQKIEQRCEEKTFWQKANCDPVAYFTIWLAGFTGILALSTVGLWVATQSILRDASDTSRKQLRAYLFIEVCFFEKILNDSFTIVLNIKNFGQTPASKIRVFGQARPFPDPKTQNFILKEPIDYRITLGPNAGYSHAIEVTKVSPEGINAITMGVDEVYVWGIIYYTDCFGVDQKTPFRLLQHGPAKDGANRFQVCAEGNDAT